MKRFFKRIFSTFLNQTSNISLADDKNNMIQSPRMVSSSVMQLHRGYEEVITPAGVQPPSRQYRCSIDLYVGRIPTPQQVLILVDTAQVEARSRAKTYTYLLLLSSNEATPQHQ